MAVGPPSARRAGPSPGAARLSPLQGSASALPPPAKVPAGQRPTEESFPQLPSGTAGSRNVETRLRDLLKVRYAPPAPLLPRPAAGGSRPLHAQPPLRGIPLRSAASSAGSHRGVPASPAHLLPPARRRAACALPGLGQGEYPRPVLSPCRDRPCPPPVTGARAGRSPVRRGAGGGGTASAARRQQPPGGDGRPGRRGPGLPAKPHPVGCPPPAPLAGRRSGRREGGGGGAPARRGGRRWAAATGWAVRRVGCAMKEMCG